MNTNLTERDAAGVLRLTQRPEGTENVWWTNENATIGQEQVKVNIFSWDYAAKRGTAMLPGGQIAEVRMTTVLTIVATEQKGQH